MAHTLQVFQRHLAALFCVGTEFPIRGAAYVESKQYVLTFKGRKITAGRRKTWSEMLALGGPLEMFVILPQEGRFESLSPKNCPRCNAALPIRSTSPVRSAASAKLVSRIALFMPNNR